MILNGILASSDEVAQCLVLRLGNPRRGQLAATQQSRERERIAAVGLDAIAGFCAGSAMARRRCSRS